MVEALLGRRGLTRETKREHNQFQSYNKYSAPPGGDNHHHQTIATMYNMNSTSLLTVPGGSGGGVDNATTTTGVTPRTPEILNSLMAMTNPFEMTRGGYPRVASSPPSDTTSSSSSPPSVQATRSQLIKEGLKLTIQTKRKANCSSSSVTHGGASPPSEALASLTTHSKSDDISMDSMQGENSGDGLTPEDEERRRRRRERNKIAATKCRLKKRERTVNLVQESEILETQNHDLKSQIKELENQRRKLVDMLSGHRPSCSKHTYTPSTSSYQEPSTSYLRCNNNNNPIIESTSSAYTFPTAGPSTSSSSSSYHKVSCESTTVAYHRNSGTSSGGASAVYESGSSYHQRTTTYVQQQGSIATTSSSTMNRVETSGGVPSYHTHLHGPPHHQTTPAESSPYMRVTGGGGDNSSVYTSLSSVASSSTGSSSTGGSTAGACSAASGNSPIMFIPSPSTPQYQRPSSLGIITTSSSDYESNTELMDSPSIPPTNYHHFDGETAGAYTAGFPTSSCIS